MKKYIITVNDKKHEVNSSASEWFVLQSTLSHIKDIKKWNIYSVEH